MEFDIRKVKTSDLIIVDFTMNPNSIATAMEIAIARDNNIPVVGICNNKEISLHPWLKETCTRLCDSYSELVEHIVNFYLN